LARLPPEVAALQNLLGSLAPMAALFKAMAVLFLGILEPVLTCLKRTDKIRYVSACRGLGSVVRPLLAARALPLRCAASTMLSSTLLAI
jgi:hypothetical protein